MAPIPPRVTGVELVQGRTVDVTFSDGIVRRVDLRPHLWGPMFAELADDDAAFARVFVDETLGTIAWPNGADLDPDVLYGAEQPA